MNEIIVDSFAGGGGASLGIFQALSRHPDVAINHDEAAIVMHAANHPKTRHYTEDIWKVKPHHVTGGRKVGLLWASPDCKHFSRAKGSKPVEKKIRSLAWVIAKWAAESKPRVIILENVREFEDWGPLVPRWECGECDWKGTEGQATLVRTRRRCPRCESNVLLKKTTDMVPDPSRKGLTFKKFVSRFESLGYKVEWRVLNAADYGAPTHRRRLFLVARCDNKAIVWPDPTHGDPEKSKDLKPWRTAAECIEWSLPCPSIFDRSKPLAEKTMRRIALGIKRYVLENQKPFIVCCNHSGDGFRGQGLDKPLCTIAASRDAHGLVTPFIARIGQGNANGNLTNDIKEPLRTVVSKNEHLLVAPFLSRFYGQSVGQDCKEPLPTHSVKTHTALVAAFLAKHYGGVVGCPADKPLPTTTARGTQNQIVAANLIHLNHGGKQDSSVEEPMRTAMSGGNHAALVYSFLVKYFGTAIGQTIDEPMHTVTGKDRFGLVTVNIKGETYVITDIGMRMLTPRELARGQGFPDSYILTGTKTSQVARIGNSVAPVVAKVLAKANCSDMKLRKEALV